MLKKKHVKELTKLFKHVKKLLEDQAAYENRLATDPEFRRLVEEAQVRLVARKRQEQIEAQERAEQDFHDTLESSEFRREVVQALMNQEGLTEEVAMNRTNSKARLYREAIKHHII
jgi:hypothetical protein